MWFTLLFRSRGICVHWCKDYLALGREYVKVSFYASCHFSLPFSAVEERAAVINSLASTSPGRGGEGESVCLLRERRVSAVVTVFIFLFLKPCGVDFILRGYVAKFVDDKIEKRLVFQHNMNAKHFTNPKSRVSVSKRYQVPPEKVLSR